MKIFIVAATLPEVRLFLTHFKLPEGNLIAAKRFNVLITGVGMTATAFALGKHLADQYALVLNVGIAGSFDRTIPLGEVVEVTTDIFAELGAENNSKFITINDLGFGNNTFQSSATINVGCRKVSAITVNKVHGEANNIAKTISIFNPQIESMEGAAVFYACEQLKLPCLQVRSISNYVEPRNKANWKIGLAIENLNKWLIDFISNFDFSRNVEIN